MLPLNISILRSVLIAMLMVGMQVVAQDQDADPPAEERIADVPVQVQPEPLVDEAPQEAPPEDKNLSEEVEALKKATLQLNRDLLILEEELLFPANTQIAVFLSVDVGEFFRLDAVKLKIDDALVASHLYTERQNDALSRGGVQRLYVGNVKSGEHELTAVFTGIGPDQREYKRGATMTVDKSDDAKMVEIRVYDANNTMQPEFEFKEWEL